MQDSQLTMFGDQPSLPEGCHYQPDLVRPALEFTLLNELSTLELRHFQFRGYTGHRRTFSFGKNYDFAAEKLESAYPRLWNHRRNIPAVTMPFQVQAKRKRWVAQAQLHRIRTLRVLLGGSARSEW